MLKVSILNELDEHRLDDILCHINDDDRCFLEKIIEDLEDEADGSQYREEISELEEELHAASANIDHLEDVIDELKSQLACCERDD